MENILLPNWKSTSSKTILTSVQLGHLPQIRAVFNFDWLTTPTQNLLNLKDVCLLTPTTKQLYRLTNLCTLKCKIIYCMLLLIVVTAIQQEIKNSIFLSHFFTYCSVRIFCGSSPLLLNIIFVCSLYICTQL